MTRQNQFDELGGYAFYRQQGHETHSDLIDNGSIAMHHQEVLHDENDTGRSERFAEVVQSAPEVRIVEESHLLGTGIKRRRQAAADPADEWMKKHGHKW